MTLDMKLCDFRKDKLHFIVDDNLFRLNRREIESFTNKNWTTLNGEVDTHVSLEDCQIWSLGVSNSNFYFLEKHSNREPQDKQNVWTVKFRNGLFVGQNRIHSVKGKIVIRDMESETLYTSEDDMNCTVNVYERSEETKEYAEQECILPRKELILMRATAVHGFLYWREFVDCPGTPSKELIVYRCNPKMEEKFPLPTKIFFPNDLNDKFTPQWAFCDGKIYTLIDTKYLVIVDEDLKTVDIRQLPYDAPHKLMHVNKQGEVYLGIYKGGGSIIKENLRDLPRDMSHSLRNPFPQYAYPPAPFPMMNGFPPMPQMWPARTPFRSHHAMPNQFNEQKLRTDLQNAIQKEKLQKDRADKLFTEKEALTKALENQQKIAEELEREKNDTIEKAHELSQQWTRHLEDVKEQLKNTQIEAQALKVENDLARNEHRQDAENKAKNEDEMRRLRERNNELSAQMTQFRVQLEKDSQRRQQMKSEYKRLAADLTSAMAQINRFMEQQ